MKCKCCNRKGVWQDLITNEWFCTRHYIDFLVGNMASVSLSGKVNPPILLREEA